MLRASDTVAALVDPHIIPVNDMDQYYEVVLYGSERLPHRVVAAAVEATAKSEVTVCEQVASNLTDSFQRSGWKISFAERQCPAGL